MLICQQTSIFKIVWGSSTILPGHQVPLQSTRLRLQPWCPQRHQETVSGKNCSCPKDGSWQVHGSFQKQGKKLQGSWKNACGVNANLCGSRSTTSSNYLGHRKIFLWYSFCSDLNLEGCCLAQECHFRLQAEENHWLDHFVISRGAALCAHKQQRCWEHYPLPFAWADSLIVVFLFVCGRPLPPWDCAARISSAPNRGITAPLNTLMQSRQLNPNFHMLVTRHLHWLNLTNLVITIRREQSLQALQLFQHGKPPASL